MLTIVFGILLCVLALPLGILLLFGGSNHSQYDHPRPSPVMLQLEESAAHKKLTTLIQDDRANSPKLGRKEMLAYMRVQMDDRGLAHQIDAQIEAVDADGVRGEWAVSPNSNPNRRVLYVHGGAYMVGSPRSHRLIAARMSQAANAAVFMVEYRLLPESKRIAGIEDCRNAYLWVLGNGPNGSNDADALIVAGDSSGGNIALSLLAWARDTNQRAADLAVMFSPQTDLTLASPSLSSNAQTDVMQGASFGPIVKAPKFIGLGFSYLMHRINPKNPNVSPLLGNLNGLPPMLFQISNVEMFLDDAVRYTNKANAQGSSVTLQVWPFALHVWQAFQLPESDEAFREVESFVAKQLETDPSV
jgi:acetyl esterase/lipase